MNRYVRCECGNVVRYRWDISQAGKCPRCERWLREGVGVTMREWLKAHDIYGRDPVSTPGNPIGIPLVTNRQKRSRRTALCVEQP